MSRHFAKVVVLGVLVLPSPVFGNQGVYNKLLPSSALIRHGQGMGSGVVVDAQRRWVLTNYHVVAEASQVSVFFPVQQSGQVVMELGHYLRNASTLAIPGQVIARDARLDLAIIELPRMPAGAQAVPFAADSALPGQDLHVVGNQVHSNSLWSYTWGKVRGKVRFHSYITGPEVRILLNAQSLITSLSSNPGDSGGPVVNDRNELVGLVSNSVNSMQVTRCIDVSEIRAFCERTRAGQLIAKSAMQAGSWSGKSFKGPDVASVRLTLNGDGNFEYVWALGKQTTVEKGTWQVLDNRLLLKIAKKPMVVVHVDNTGVIDLGYSMLRKESSSNPTLRPYPAEERRRVNPPTENAGRPERPTRA